MLAWVAVASLASPSAECAVGSAADCVQVALRDERRHGPAAAAWAWRRACDLGDGRACLVLARHVAAGRVVTSDPSGGDLLARACALGVGCGLSLHAEVNERECRGGDASACERLVGQPDPYVRDVLEQACDRGLVPCDRVRQDYGRDAGTISLDLSTLIGDGGAPVTAGAAFDGWILEDGVVVHPSVDLGVGSGIRTGAAFALGAGRVVGRALTVGLDAGLGVDLLEPRIGTALTVPLTGTALLFPHRSVAIALRPRLAWTVAGPVDRRERVVPFAHEVGASADLYLGRQGSSDFSAAPHVGAAVRWWGGTSTVGITLGVGGTDRGSR